MRRILSGLTTSMSSSERSMRHSQKRAIRSVSNLDIGMILSTLFLSHHVHPNPGMNIVSTKRQHLESGTSLTWNLHGRTPNSNARTSAVSDLTTISLRETGQPSTNWSVHYILQKNERSWSGQSERSSLARQKIFRSSSFCSVMQAQESRPCSTSSKICLLVTSLTSHPSSWLAVAMSSQQASSSQDLLSESSMMVIWARSRTIPCWTQSSLTKLSRSMRSMRKQFPCGSMHSCSSAPTDLSASQKESQAWDEDWSMFVLQVQLWRLTSTRH